MMSKWLGEAEKNVLKVTHRQENILAKHEHKKQVRDLVAEFVDSTCYTSS